MARKQIASGLVAASLALSPVQAAASDALAGGIVGALIGGLIVHEANKQRRTQAAPRRSTQSSVTAASSGTQQRETNREVQTALNYFGYNVGTADGVIGPRSRTGISQYQALMGYPPSGQLTDLERTILVTAYQRAMIGGAATMQVTASHPQGVRGLLLVQRDEMLGVPQTQMAYAAPQAAPAAPSITIAAPEQPATALPNFFGTAAAAVSLASHCNRVSLQTSTQGGFVTLATLTDAGHALSEQFCLARTYAMSQAEDLVAQLPGVTPQQVADQCATLGPALKDAISAASLKDRDAVLADVSSFVLASGVAPVQLGATARVCLGSGYSTDTMDVAVASAMLMAALGERTYGELVGHHLAQGFGMARRPDLALGWFEMAATSAMTGGELVVVPGLPDRNALIHRAALILGGQGDRQGAVAPAPAPETGLPVFNIPVARAPEGTLAAAPQPGSGATAGNAGTSDHVEITRRGVDALPMAARLPYLLLGSN